MEKLNNLAQKNPEIKKLLELYSATQENPELVWDRIVVTCMERIECSVNNTSFRLDDVFLSGLLEIIKTRVGAQSPAKRGRSKKEEEKEPEGGEEEKEPETFNGPVITPETANLNKNVPRN